MERFTAGKGAALAYMLTVTKNQTGLSALIGMNNREKEDLFEELSYQFKRTDMSDDILAEIGNNIIKMTVIENDPIVLESMFHAVHTLAEFHDTANYLDMNMIVGNLHKYDKQCTDYIAAMLSYTGDIRYLDVLHQIGERFPELQTDICEDMEELKCRASGG